ncbi:MAG: sodium/proton-translocating pyrophosphatase, partial [Crocinitomicaceae bacterium]
MENNLIYILPAFGILGLIYMMFLTSWVNKQSAGSDKMKKLSGYIANGAMAFLKAEYRMLAVFVLIAGGALGALSALNLIPAGLFIVVSFVIGAVFSALAGNIGMRIATKANVRTAEAAKTSLPQAMKVAFRGGTVMGLGVAGLAVFGLSAIFALLVMQGGEKADMVVILETLAGFSLGAECIALFARVGGGIYTKAADVGADLVGKVEAGIPEDDPRNPATIADNVGDNVGDVAGMGADLFGSYVATMLAAMVLGNYLILQDPGTFTK